ncbi:FAD-dependent monooxygenase [Nonomuraea sp. NPDC050310]|uniref:FAD-dependent monooxygenase n=1 Tax=Nonomuraea sp. NPDC050310 TaxID=3154935 RepID=UPI0033F2B05B
MTTTKHVLISGGGIAGPALAYWLHRHGFAATVVEKAPAPRDGGHAVDFRGEVHLSLLRSMGLLEGIERLRTGMGPMTYVDARGKRLVDSPADLFSGDVEILRGDLAGLLHERTKPFTEYVFGDSITSLTEDATGVHVTFERGAPRRFDLVVGADGIHSGVRRLVFGEEARFIKHLGLHYAIFTVPNYLGLDHAGRIYTTPGKLVSYYTARRNTEARAVFYFAAGELPHARRDTAAQRAVLREHFAGVGWESDELLRRMDQAPELFFDQIAQVKLDSWARGRVVLLGDAACCASPLSGMGTGLAMIGAYVLAGELAEAGGDHRTAFARYEAELREYAEGCQKSADGVSGFLVPKSRRMAWLLRQQQRLLPYLPGKKLIAKSVRKTAEAITLKPYAGKPVAPAGPRLVD